MRDGYLIPPRFKHCSMREYVRMILGFLAQRYPASFTADEIASRLAISKRFVAAQLGDLLASGLVNATKDRIDNSIAWNITPRGLKELTSYEPVKRSRRKFFGRRKSIYIAGPMSGRPDNNFPKFFDAEARLMADGWEPINPSRFSGVFGEQPAGKMLDACCEAELATIPHCDAIFLLKGWENSKGAKRELAVALQHNLEVIVEVAEG